MPLKKKEIRTVDNDYESLLAKVNQEHSNLEVVKYVSHVVLPSGYLGRVKEGIALVLTDVLLKYSTTLNGLPLAFNNKRVKLLSRMAEIVADQPYVHFNVETDLILFKPKHGDVLQGVIRLCHTQSKHLRFGCLVHEYIYAYGSCRKDKFNLKIGDVVLVEVIDVHHDGYELLVIEVKLLKLVSCLASVAEQTPLTENDSGIDENLNKLSPSTKSFVDPLVSSDEVKTIKKPNNKKKKEKKAKKAKKEPATEVATPVDPKFGSALRDMNFKESKTDFIPINNTNDEITTSSFRHWLNNRTTSLQADDDVTDLLTFEKKRNSKAPNKRRRSPSANEDSPPNESLSPKKKRRRACEKDVTFCGITQDITPPNDVIDLTGHHNVTSEVSDLPLAIHPRDRRGSIDSTIRSELPSKMQTIDLTAIASDDVGLTQNKDLLKLNDKKLKKLQKKALKEEKKQHKLKKKKRKEEKKKRKEEKNKRKEEKKKHKEEKRRIKIEKKLKKKEKRGNKFTKEEKRLRKIQKQTEQISEPTMTFPELVASLNNKPKKEPKSRKRRLLNEDAQFLPKFF